MIDTHCHIYLDQFQDDRVDVLDRAHAAGVTDIFMPAIDFSSLDEMQAVHHSSIQFHNMAGLHPVDVKAPFPDLEETLLRFCQSDDIVGVGETGLDYYWSTEHKECQKQSLNVHLNVAKQVAKPIILHNRESTSDLLATVEEQQDGSLTGIWHCFNGTLEEGKKAIDLGLLLGIGGVITFKNGGVDRTVAQLPMEYMVLETDAPYLTPTPYRGKRNEPAYVGLVAQKLADIFECSREEVITRTTANANALFFPKENI